MCQHCATNDGVEEARLSLLKIMYNYMLMKKIAEKNGYKVLPDGKIEKTSNGRVANFTVLDEANEIDPEIFERLSKASWSNGKPTDPKELEKLKERIKHGGHKQG